ncbi:alanine racemase [Elusimicrobiota bacterium]
MTNPVLAEKSFAVSHTKHSSVCLVDLDALRWNFQRVVAMVGRGVRVLSVVKANAYGHGACSVARALEGEGSDYLGVATIDEGVELRASGIRAPILVFARIYPELFDKLVAYRLTPVVHEPFLMSQLDEFANKRGVFLCVHLKIDTGMSRLGFPVSEIDDWFGGIKRLKVLNIEGVMSHLAESESDDKDFTSKQIALFRQCMDRLREGGLCPRFTHLANSGAIIAWADAHCNMVRPGLMLYGVPPSPTLPQRAGLRPVLSWKTSILQLKRVLKGSGVSYGRTFIASRESVIATLPIGYADGYHRTLSNRAYVLVRGQRAPVVGRICMDLTMVDVTDIAGVKQDDEVVLLGVQGSDEISADEIAGWAGTISYEMFTSISSRVPRIHTAAAPLRHMPAITAN